MKKRHSAEQIVVKLRQADVGLGKGLRVPEVCKELGISEQTYYRWRKKYGGMAPQVARKPRYSIPARAGAAADPRGLASGAASGRTVYSVPVYIPRRSSKRLPAEALAQAGREWGPGQTALPTAPHRDRMTIVAQSV